MAISIIANSQVSFESMGGSDKIFIELARSWKKGGIAVSLYGCREAGRMCAEYGLKDEFRVVSRFDVARFGLFCAYLFRTLGALFSGRLIKRGVLYSSSDFLPDTVFAFRQKLINSRIKWAAGIFLIAPNPLINRQARSPRGVIYWLTQKFAVSLMRLKADLVIVLCGEDKEELVRSGIRGEKIAVISPGIDTETIAEVPGQESKKYQACFVGRFHPQKGIPQMLKIWKKVCVRFPKARLALIGWGSGSWVNLIKSTVSGSGLGMNVDMLGFLDNREKYKVLKSSDLFLFTSSYESWGIVVAEALGCGCPVVAFDIPATRKFNKGTVLVEQGNVEKFTETVVDLLSDKQRLSGLSAHAREAAAAFDWKNAADTIVSALGGKDV